MTNEFWKGKKILVTGGSGFVGSHVVEMLVDLGADVTVPSRRSLDELTFLSSTASEIRVVKTDLTALEEAREACKGQEVVLNLAAHIGGIEANMKYPATFLRKNLLIASQTIEAARLERVERFLVVSSACVYPRFCKIPTPESEGFVGIPEPTNEGYGWGKRMAEKLGEFYAKGYGMKVGIVRPYNIYGPRDQFDPKLSHVIPALIKKVFDGNDPLIVWGSGNQSRAFLYVTDVARGIITAIEKYPEPDPLNLGTNEEVKIKDLVYLIVELSGKTPKIVFDTSKAEGQPRRNCDTSKTEGRIGFKAQVSLREGLKKTIDWYSNERFK